jgi:hypothetical protein
LRATAEAPSNDPAAPTATSSAVAVNQTHRGRLIGPTFSTPVPNRSDGRGNAMTLTGHEPWTTPLQFPALTSRSPSDSPDDSRAGMTAESVLVFQVDDSAFHSSNPEWGLWENSRSSFAVSATWLTQRVPWLCVAPSREVCLFDCCQSTMTCFLTLQ